MDIATLPPVATFIVKGHPDWLAVTSDAVWVASSNVNHVVRLDATTNQPGTIITVAKPCSGMATDFGSLWIPSCGDHTLVRADAKTGAIQATIPAGPADSEGGIATGAGSVWLVTSKASELDRIDATTNSVVAKIAIPAGSFNPVFANDSIWVSSNEGNALIRVNPATNTVTSSTPIGPMPRFLTVGAGSVWVLNQGDGSISRVDAATGKLIANDSGGHSGIRWRDCLRRGGGVGHCLQVSHHQDRSSDQHRDAAMAWCGRRQHPLWPRLALAHQLFRRKGLAAGYTGKLSVCGGG